MTLPPDLTFAPDSNALLALRNAWRWLLGDDWTPVLFSVIGDVFMQLPAGHIWWLDTAIGELEQVAESRQDFLEALHTERADEWFLPGLVDVLQQQGKHLLPGQCYGYATLPVFAEGSFSAENMFPVDASEYFSLTGAIHHSLCGLKDGELVHVAFKV